MYDINTAEYWNSIYKDTKKEIKKRKRLGEEYMASIIPLLHLRHDYEGTICDFGCGMGWGVVELCKTFPKATIIGADHSDEVITFCKQYHGNIANFICTKNNDIPRVDIIISSHTMEHLTDDHKIVRDILKNCTNLFIAVPYRQDLRFDNAHGEHVNSYDETYYNEINGFECANLIWRCRPSSYMQKIWLFTKGHIRQIIGKPKEKACGKHIVFIFTNKKGLSDNK